MSTPAIPAPTLTPALTFDLTKAKQAGYSDDEILNHLATTQKFDVQGALKAGYSKQDILTHLSQPFEQKILQKQKELGLGAEKVDQVIDFLRPIVAPAAGAAVTAATGGAGAIPIAAGLGAGLLTDIGMQAARSKPDTGMLQEFAKAKPGSTAAQILNAEGTLLGGELGSAAINRLRAAGKYAGELAQTGIGKLQPTYSQLYKSTFGKEAPAAKWIEDIFASGAKAKAIEQSATIAKGEAEEIARKTAGRLSVKNPFITATNIQMAAEQNLAKSYAASDAQANAAKLVAKANVVEVPGTIASSPEIDAIAKSQTGRTFQNLNPQEQQTVLQLGAKLGLKPPVQTVEGPISLNNTVSAAKGYLDDKMKLYGNLTGAPDPEKPLIAAAQRILSVANPVLDDAGNITKVSPISFEDAWNFKKAADRFAYGEPKQAIGYASGMFRKISNALNSDIDTSIGQWQNDPTQAGLKAWQNAKATVAQRLQLYGQGGLKELINKTDSPIPAVDNILADPTKLQRALTAGKLKLPGGEIASTNMKRDLQGYQINSWFGDKGNWIPDPTDPTKGNFNIQKVVADFYDPNNMEKMKLLFNSEQRADIGQFLKNLAITQEKQATNPFGSKIWLVHGGVALGSGMLTGSLTGSALYGGSVVAARLGGYGLAKALTNPKTARYMVALAQGTPLEISDQALGKKIMGVIQGSTMALIDAQGNEHTGTVNAEGKFVPDEGEK